MDRLLREGADVNSADEFGWSPLHHACYNGGMETVLLLLDKGADIDQRSNCGRTPLHKACMNGHNEISLLLLDRGATIDVRDSIGWTSLHWACFDGHKETAVLLISRGADIDAESVDGNTPIDLTSVLVDPYEDADGDDYQDTDEDEDEDEDTDEDEDDGEEGGEDEDDYVDYNRPVDETATEEMRAALRRERINYLNWLRRKAFLAVLVRGGCLRAGQQPLAQDFLVDRVFRVMHRDIASYL